MDFEKSAREILLLIGGKENVKVRGGISPAFSYVKTL
jgi:hypothetical protein